MRPPDCIENRVLYEFPLKILMNQTYVDETQDKFSLYREPDSLAVPIISNRLCNQSVQRISFSNCSHSSSAILNPTYIACWPPAKTNIQNLIAFQNQVYMEKKKIVAIRNLCIPHEIIFEILKEVPAKSLMRFRCVSKSFCSLIS
uniref:Uncharacterized protein LOC104227988 n=1 Tax=Nicotiana sylvestris TaxID=4096 RepID=A0A1U7WN07_NICSY|nr:PREDICTED: uncharacterized protein LOC104227988 [Nicotiana sylvestris]